MKSRRNQIYALILLVFVFLLHACGGGGSDGDSNSPVGPTGTCEWVA